MSFVGLLKLLSQNRPQVILLQEAAATPMNGPNLRTPPSTNEETKALVSVQSSLSMTERRRGKARIFLGGLNVWSMVKVNDVLMVPTVLENMLEPVAPLTGIRFLLSDFRCNVASRPPGLCLALAAAARRAWKRQDRCHPRTASARPGKQL